MGFYFIKSWFMGILYTRGQHTSSITSIETVHSPGLCHYETKPKQLNTLHSPPMDIRYSAFPVPTLFLAVHP